MNEQQNKHERSRAWDDRMLPGWAWPVKVALRALSSVRMAVVLLGLIGLYAAVGSVPIHWLPGVDLPHGTMLWMLPGLEMTQGEFFGAWPVVSLLVAFVLNMIVATARRIELRFENVGVLTVHGGIVLIAAGSAVYAASRREGVLVLPMSADGSREVTRAWDAWETQLIVRDEKGERSAVLLGLPRYNDYGTAWSARALSLITGVEGWRIDGFAAYAESEEVAVELTHGSDGAAPDIVAAWEVRVRARGEVEIDSGSAVVSTADDGREGLRVPGIVEVRGGPGRDEPAREPVRVWLGGIGAAVEASGQRTAIDEIKPGGVLRVAPGVELVFERFIERVRFERVQRRVPELERRRELVGTRRHGLIRVVGEGGKRGVWVPLSLDADEPTRIGEALVWWRPIEMELGGWRLAMEAFEPVMREEDPGASAAADPAVERDFRAMIVARHAVETDELTSHDTRREVIALNRPMSLPMMSGGGGGVLDVLPARLSIVHASWDREGWENGLGVRFAVFGVSVVRGAELIAAGAVCVVVGSPWAFYVKPWLRRRREATELARQTGVRP